MNPLTETSTPGFDSVKRARTQFYGVLVLALLVRLVGINSRPIWYDEAFSILYSETGPANILAGTLSIDRDASSADVHPPLYYFLLWGWIKGFGSSLIAVRLLSILAGLGIVAMTYQLGILWFKHQTAIAAGILVALSPFQVHFAQEIRMYGIATLFLCMALYCLEKGRQTGRAIWWLGFALSAALAEYTHNLSIFFLIIFIVPFLFSRDSKSILSLVWSGIVSMFLYLPWLVWLPSQFANIRGGYWIQTPGAERLFTLFLLFLPNLPAQTQWLPLLLIFSTFIIAICFFQTFIVNRKEHSRGARLFYFSFAPPFLIWLVSQLWPVYLERSLLPAQIFFCLWLGWVLSETSVPRLIFISLIGLTGMLYIAGLFQHVTNSRFPYAEYDHLADYLQREKRPGDLIIHSNKLTLLPTLYFSRSLPQAFIEDRPGSNTDTLSPATIDVLELTAYPDMPVAVDFSPRVWFVIFQESVDEYKAAGYPTHAHLAYMDENFELVSLTHWNDLLLYQFQRRN